MSGSDSKSRAPHHAVLISLRSTFPVFQECRPLAIGIHKTVLERIPGINPQQLRLAMRMHTASARYLKALTNGETRFDLDGNASGAVTPEQKEQALETLRERALQEGCRATQGTGAGSAAGTAETAKAHQTRGKVQCTMTQGLLAGPMSVERDSTDHRAVPAIND